MSPQGVVPGVLRDEGGAGTSVGNAARGTGRAGLLRRGRCSRDGADGGPGAGGGEGPRGSHLCDRMDVTDEPKGVRSRGGRGGDRPGRQGTKRSPSSGPSATQGATRDQREPRKGCLRAKPHCFQVSPGAPATEERPPGRGIASSGAWHRTVLLAHGADKPQVTGTGAARPGTRGAARCARGERAGRRA